MDAALRQLVWERAEHRCEYCRLQQEQLPYATLHVEHVIPRKHGGTDDPVNLALACDRCNFHKGPNLSGLHPTTGEMIALFNPRTQVWEEHFRVDSPRIVGRTAIGTVTVQVLNFNALRRVQLRARLLADHEL